MCGILAVLQSHEEATRMRQKVLSKSVLQRHRGPDWSGMHQFGNNFLAHERLAIIDPASGDQPLFNTDKTVCVTVNGEIYNHKALKAMVMARDPSIKMRTDSDCEVISHLYQLEGEKVASMLDGMFSFVLLDERDDSYYIARDPIGITSLYIGWDKDGALWVASEMKCLQADCAQMQQFPPGHYYSSKTKEFTRYYNPAFYLDFEAIPPKVPDAPLDLTKLRNAFVAAVEKRLMSDVPFGVLLSGGLDSSLVASVAARKVSSRYLPTHHASAALAAQQANLPTLCKPALNATHLLANGSGKGAKVGLNPGSGWGRLHSFCVGLPGSPDLKAAKEVATFLGTTHHEFTFTVQDGIDAISDVIRHVETFDTTTIRASTPMFLMARKIKAMGVKMVLSGEGSDEVFGGYLYFHKAPNKEEFFMETVRKVQALHKYDCLRANKSTMAWGVEARVPFLDKHFMEVAMGIDPAEKMIDKSKGRIEKYILRKAFDTPERPYLPESVLWRQKEQFSDGVGYNWIDGIKDHAERVVTDRQLDTARHRFPDNTPRTKEAYWYRTLFTQHFPTKAAMDTVPGGPSVACSTPTAALWDAAWAGKEDPSGRAVGVHDSSYDATAAPAGSTPAAQPLAHLNGGTTHLEPQAKKIKV